MNIDQFMGTLCYCLFILRDNIVVILRLWETVYFDVIHVCYCTRDYTLLRDLTGLLKNIFAFNKFDSFS